MGHREENEQVWIVPPGARGIRVMNECAQGLTEGFRPIGDDRLRFLVTAPISARLHRRTGGEAGLSVGEVSEGSLDVALNVLGYYVPPGEDEREMVRCRVNFVSATAYEHHREFCEQFLAEGAMDPAGGVIADEDIMEWIEAGSAVRFDRRGRRGPEPAALPAECSDGVWAGEAWNLVNESYDGPFDDPLEDLFKE